MRKGLLFFSTSGFLLLLVALATLLGTPTVIAQVRFVGPLPVRFLAGPDFWLLMEEAGVDPTIGSDISVSWKQVDKTEALPGDLLSYALIVNNGGTITASVQVRDDLPQTRFVSFVPDSLSVSQGMATWLPEANNGFGRVHWSGDVAPGGSVRIEFQMRVSASAELGTEIVNEVIFGDATAGLLWYDEVSTRVVWPDIATPRKTVDKATVKEGQVLSYALAANNHGTTTARVQVRDLLPRTAAAGFMGLSLSASRGVAYYEPTANDGYGIVRWEGDLLPGEGITLTYQMHINLGTQAGTLITNTALFTEVRTGRRYRVGATAQVVAPVLSGSHKSVDKTEVQPGDRLEYWIVAANDGTGLASLQLQDALPRIDGLTLEVDSLTASRGSAEWHPERNDGYGMITWLGLLGSGERVAVSFRLLVGEEVPPGTVITNAVSFADTETSVRWQDTVTSTVVAPDLSHSYKSVDKALARPGSTLTYTIVATNTGTAPADLLLRDDLPHMAQVALVTDSLHSTWGTPVYDPAANGGFGAILWRHALDPGESVVISFTMQLGEELANGTVITNHVSFLDQTSAREWTDVAVTTVGAPDLAGSGKSVDLAVAFPGEALAYTIVARNSGWMSATVRIDDDLPRIATVSLVTESLAASKGQVIWRPRENRGYGDLIWDGDLEIGEAVTITYRMNISSLAMPDVLITNHVSFADVAAGKIWTDSVATEVLGPDIRTSRKLVDKLFAKPGDVLTYTLVLANTGNTGDEMNIRDDLPRTSAVHFLDGSLSATSGGAIWNPLHNEGYGTIYWTGSVGVGETVTVTFQMLVAEDAVPGAVITNSALFGETAIGRQVAAQATTRVISTDLSGCRKQVSQETARSGDILRYTLLATNQGNYTTTVAITDTLPRISAVQLLTDTIAATSGTWAWDPAANDGYGLLFWRGEVGAGAAVTITFDMHIWQARPDVGAIVNEAEFRDLVAGESYTDSVSTRLLLPVISTSRKLVDKPEARPGEVLSYTLIGRNTGEYTATLQIADLLPHSAALQLLTDSIAADWGIVGFDPLANDGYGALFWEGLVGPGRAVNITYQMQIRTDVPEREVLTNQAHFREMSTGAFVKRTASTTLQFSNISSSHKLADRETIAIGEVVSYTLVATNSGTLTATVQISDPLPHVDAVHWRVGSLSTTKGEAHFDPIANAGYGLVSWVGEIGPSETLTVTFALYLDHTAVAGQVITNTATFVDAVGGQRVESQVVTLVLAPDLSHSSKAVDKAEARPGDVLTYTLVALNRGNVLATTRISDTLPATTAVQFVPSSASASQGTVLYDPAANGGYGLLLWSGRIEPQEAVTITFQMRVVQKAAAGEVITNRVAFWDTARGYLWERLAATMLLPPEVRLIRLPLVLKSPLGVPPR